MTDAVDAVVVQVKISRASYTRESVAEIHEPFGEGAKRQCVGSGIGEAIVAGPGDMDGLKDVAGDAMRDELP